MGKVSSVTGKRPTALFVVVTMIVSVIEPGSFARRPNPSPRPSPGGRGSRVPWPSRRLFDFVTPVAFVCCPFLRSSSELPPSVLVPHSPWITPPLLALPPYPSVPVQLDPAPAVQPKQWAPLRTGRESNSGTVYCHSLRLLRSTCRSSSPGPKPDGSMGI